MTSHPGQPGPQNQPGPRGPQGQQWPQGGPPPHGGPLANAPTRQQPPPPGWRPPGAPPQQPGPWSPNNPQSTGPATGGIWLAGLVSLAAVIAGLSIPEDDKNAWDSVHAWGALAIVGAILVLAPALGASGPGPERAWQLSCVGSAALVLFWLTFTFPAAGSNTSFVVTVGVAAGLLATWQARRRNPASPTQPGADRRPPGPPTW